GLCALNRSFYELPCLCLKVCFANNKEPPRFLLTASRDELHRGSKTQGQPIHGQNDMTILRDNYDRGNRKIRAGVPQEMPMLPVRKAWDLRGILCVTVPVLESLRNARNRRLFGSIITYPTLAKGCSRFPEQGAPVLDQPINEPTDGPID